MFIDDLCFGSELPGVSDDAGAEVTAHIAEGYNRLARQRQARDKRMDDVRTTRLATIRNIADEFTRIDGQLNYLIATAENDEGALQLLRNQVTHAKERAVFIHAEYAKRSEVTNG